MRMQNEKLPYMVVRHAPKDGTFWLALKHEDIQQDRIDSSIHFIAEALDVLPLTYATGCDRDSSGSIHDPCTARRRIQPPGR